MWKPEIYNQTLPPRMPQWINSRRKYNIQDDIKTLLGRECEVKKILKFHKQIKKFEEIWPIWVADNIGMILAASYNHKWLWLTNNQLTYPQGAGMPIFLAICFAQQVESCSSILVVFTNSFLGCFHFSCSLDMHLHIPLSF